MSNVPSSIKLHRKSGILELAFGAEVFSLRAEYLRVFSPSAEVTGHRPGEEVLQLNKQHVAITKVEPQGNYALRLFFDDGHDSGIYSWDYLYELGAHENEKWQDYCQRVERHRTQADTSVVRWLEPSEKDER